MLLELNAMLWICVAMLGWAYACGRVDGAKAACRALGREDLADRFP